MDRKACTKAVLFQITSNVKELHELMKTGGDTKKYLIGNQFLMIKAREFVSKKVTPTQEVLDCIEFKLLEVEEALSLMSKMPNLQINSCTSSEFLSFLVTLLCWQKELEELSVSLDKRAELESWAASIS